MFHSFVNLPVWIILFVCTSIFLSVMFGARHIVRRYSTEHQAETIDLAKSMNGPTAASLAFLVGFAVTLSVGTITAAQQAVEKVAIEAQQLALVADSLENTSEAEKINASLTAYLTTIAEDDRTSLEAGQFVEMPSFVDLETLQEDVRKLSVSGSTTKSDTASTLQSSVSNLARAQADLNAVARRDVPPIVLQLLFLTGVLSAVTVGIVAAGVERPRLIVGWALISALGLTVVLALNDPFGGGVSVTFQPLLDAASRIGL